MNDEFRRAKGKGIKFYSAEEISKAKTEMERSRRKFWNEKAEQLCLHPETAKREKTVIHGIIDVAWTLRKVDIIENDARKLLRDEQELFGDEDSATSTSKKVGKQKASTIPHNQERMEIARQEVINTDKKLQIVREKYNLVSNAGERKKLKEEKTKLENALSGVYTELKRAQDALVKSLNHKRELLNQRLKRDTDNQPE